MSSFHDLVQGTHTWSNSGRAGHRRSPTHTDPGAAPLADLSGSRLATIRESRCLSDQHWTPDQPSIAFSNQTTGTLPELSQISVSLDVNASRVRVQLIVSEAKTQQAGTLLCPNAPAACEQNEGALGANKNVHGESCTSCEACCWQLRVHQGSSAMILMDTVIDLNASVTSVPHTYPHQLFGHTLPARCVILGVCSGPDDVLDQQQGHPKVVRRQELLVHPQLEDSVLQQLLGQSQSARRARIPPPTAKKGICLLYIQASQRVLLVLTRTGATASTCMQEWQTNLQRGSQGYTGGLVDAIVNTLFPFPLPPARQPQTRQLPRNTSSPSERDAVAGGASSSTPRSLHTSRTTFHHRRQRSFDSAPGLQPTPNARFQDSSLTSTNTALYLGPHGRSTALSTSSASTAGSDTRSTSISQKHGSLQPLSGQRSMPAMQYVAFAVREIAELVGARQQAVANTVNLKDRVTEAVHTCRAALDLEAKVKQLQVKTQQVCTYSCTHSAGA